MAYKIASFNLRGLKEGENKSQNFSKIAEIIKGQGYQLMALQEVTDEYQFESFLKHLGTHWQGSWTKPKEYSTASAKGYAFVWNADVFCPAKTDRKRGVYYYPREVKRYRLDRDSGQIRLVRRPLYGRFIPVDPVNPSKPGLPIEIRLINLHIGFNVPKDATEKAILSTKQLRWNEFDILTRVIYDNKSDWNYKGGYGAGSAYTLLCGDYNMNLERAWTRSDRVIQQLEKKYSESYMLLPVGYKSVLHQILSEGGFVYINEPEVVIQGEQNTKRIVTVQDRLTTLKNSLKDEDLTAERKRRYRGLLQKKLIPLQEEWLAIADYLIGRAEEEYRIYMSNYDHFSYDMNRFEGTVVKVKADYDVIRAKRYFGEGTEREKAKKYLEQVSDHIPVVFELDLKG